MTILDIECELFKISKMDIPSFSIDSLADLDTKIYEFKDILYAYSKSDRVIKILEDCDTIQVFVHKVRCIRLHEKTQNSDILEPISSWAADPKPLSKDIRKQVLTVLDNQNLRTNVFIAALAQNKIRSLANLLDKLSIMEEKMFSESMIDNADYFKLERMMTLCYTAANNIMSFLKDLSNKSSAVSAQSVLEHLEDSSESVVTRVETEQSYGREKLRILLTKLQDNINIKHEKEKNSRTDLV